MSNDTSSGCDNELDLWFYTSCHSRALEVTRVANAVLRRDETSP
jgi:hypothetical protein